MLKSYNRKNSNKNNKVLVAVILFILISLLYNSQNVSAIDSCPQNYITLQLGQQNAHLFRNDINIGMYSASSGEFITGTNTNFTFTLASKGIINSVQSFSIGQISSSSQINESNIKINVQVPQESKGNHMIIVYAESKLNVNGIETNGNTIVNGENGICRSNNILSYRCILQTINRINIAL
jgi:hypothetical protein